jgi:hypothetical protein
MEKVLGTEETGEAVARFLVGAAELNALIDRIRGGNSILKPVHMAPKGVNLLLECGGFVTDLGSR